MRQASRYLSEYNTARVWVGSFPGLAKSPMYATEVTLQPLDRYPLDAAILSSNVLTVSDVTDLELSFTQGEDPRFIKPVRAEADMATLPVSDMSSPQYMSDAMTETRHVFVQDGRQCMPLIGLSGNPWMLACYMTKGDGSDDFRTIKSMFYARPDLAHRILETNVQAVINYLNTQIDAGAQAVQVFDTWGGALVDGIYQQLSLAYIARMVNSIRIGADGQRVPVILFTKDGDLWLRAIAETDADALGVDWTVNLQLARRRTVGRVTLQGNLDPTVLFTESEAIRVQVRRMLEDYAAHSGSDSHIFSFGHGISQLTPPEAVSVLVDEVHSFGHALRTKAESHGQDQCCGAIAFESYHSHV